jgi:hypothetical protein
VDINHLRRLAAEVDDEHREAMRTFGDDFARSVFDADAETRASRRNFLRGIGLGGAAMTVGTTTVLLPALTGAAAAQESTTTTVEAVPISAAPTTTPPSAAQPEDKAILGFAQSIELAAVTAYGVAADSKLLTGDLLTIADTFRSHHLQHAEAMAGQAGKLAPAVANESVLTAFGPRLTEAKNLEELLTAIYEFENLAASTYTMALGVVQGTNPAALIASILPIEARHAVVWGQALEFEPQRYVPTFEDPDAALTPDEFPIREEQ